MLFPARRLVPLLVPVLLSACTIHHHHAGESAATPSAVSQAAPAPPTPPTQPPAAQWRAFCAELGTFAFQIAELRRDGILEAQILSRIETFQPAEGDHPQARALVRGIVEWVYSESAIVTPAQFRQELEETCLQRLAPGTRS